MVDCEECGRLLRRVAHSLKRTLDATLELPFDPSYWSESVDVLRTCHEFVDLAATSTQLQGDGVRDRPETEVVDIPLADPPTLEEYRELAADVARFEHEIGAELAHIGVVVGTIVRDHRAARSGKSTLSRLFSAAAALVVPEPAAAASRGDEDITTVVLSALTPAKTYRRRRGDLVLHAGHTLRACNGLTRAVAKYVKVTRRVAPPSPS